ncbi:MAG: mitochondrial fission ELM1 family protein [Candidatus Omnitrophica bacterium]|nr:mitochondrial fission ELM1 family protein [Candidatus Omnitrophota bacterium]
MDLIASLAARLFCRIFQFTPMGFNLMVGRALGSLAYLAGGRRTKITYSNLKAAFASEKTPAELRRITVSVYRNIAMTIAEIMSLRKVDKAYIDKYVKVENIERIEEASRNPGGMILISAHFGNWELSCVASAMMGFPLNLLARDQKMSRVNDLFIALRESKGNKVMRKGMDVKNLLKVLKDGKSIGLLADQNAGRSGELIKLFGRPASTAQGPYRFAKQTGALILPAFIHRIDNSPYQVVELEEPFSIDKKEDIVPYMERYNRLLEKHIKRDPDHWFWVHKKWKITPLKKVLVLDDGKKGHLKQSLALADLIVKYRISKGFSPLDLTIDTVTVEFKSNWTRFMTKILAPFMTSFLMIHLGILKRVLKEKTYNELVHGYWDVIVSAGSSLYGVNLAMKTENMARSVAVFDPGVLVRDKFDLAVIPRHDAEKKDHSRNENVVITELLLVKKDHYGQPDPPPAAVAVNDGSPRKGVMAIGLLVGGENEEFSFDGSLAEELLAGMIETCRDSGSIFHVTTSRRTPAKVAEILLRGFSRGQYLGSFVNGNNDISAVTVEKILGSSDIVVVSGESISMVSEAVSSGKPVLVFMPPKKKKAVSKYEKFVSRLEKDGVISVIRPRELNDALHARMASGVGGFQSDDDRKVMERMYRLF